MKVKCITTTINNEQSGYLTADSVYPVLAIKRSDSNIWYLLIDDNYDADPLPYWYDQELFSIADGTIPDSWTIHTDDSQSVITFSNWNKNAQNFYEDLYESKQNTSEDFTVNKHRICALYPEYEEKLFDNKIVEAL